MWKFIYVLKNLLLASMIFNFKIIYLFIKNANYFIYSNYQPNKQYELLVIKTK